MARKAKKANSKSKKADSKSKKADSKSKKVKKSREKENSYNKSYRITKKELQAEIREKTAKVNWRIQEYREAVEKGEMKPNVRLEKYIERMKANSAYVNKKGELVIPTSKVGEIGLGLTNKNKANLQIQLFTMRRFLEGDTDTPEAKRAMAERSERSYQTFLKNRHTYLTREQYDEAIDTLNTVKFMLRDYGYESNGGGFADKYLEASQEGKEKFIYYVEQAKKETRGMGADPDALIRKLAEIMRGDGVLHD